MSNLLNGNPTETPPETLSQPAGPTSLTGLVEGFTYNSSEFSVAKMKPTGQMLSVTIVGSLLGVAVGQTITVHGQWQKHNRFGDQFRVTSFATEVPKTRDGLIAYLASDLIPGLGKSKATILVDYFKEKTIQILDLEPRRITEVPGIGKKTARKIVEGWQTHRNMADLQMFLQDHGLGSGLAARIHNAYEDKALTILQQNPYMITDVRGFGFLTADKVARSLGLPDDDPFRIRSAIAHALDQAANEDGHLYLPRTKLVEAVEKLLNRWRDDVPNQNESIRVDAEAVEIQIAALQQAEGVMIDMLSTITEGGIEVEAMVALPWAYRTEIGIAQKVKRLLGNPISKIRQAFKDTDWDKALTWVQSQTGIRLAQSQAQAVHMTMNEQVAILTGGPGTGKTTTIRSILTLLGQSEARIQLAAPTGKAAKRLSESTGVEAKTIHRLLGVEGPGQFSKDENNPLKADMIIVDEMSMVDASLFYSLIKAIKPDTHLLLVGDVDQLPSVGPGDILNDLIRSGLIPTVQLDVIFRQGEESGIVPNAHRVNGGDLPIFSKVGEGSNDFFWFGIEDDHRAAEQIVDLVAEKIPNRFGISSRDIQVLSPMYRGQVGIAALNTVLQERLNPSKGKGMEYVAGDRLWRVGDRLMQTRNDYNRDVFNGDTGMLMGLDLKNKQAIVEFEGRMVTYELPNLREDTVLSYACSIHKSQGSEYPAVVIPVTTGHYVMLARNLIYTAITRAKQLVILVGTQQALAMAVNNAEAAQRYTALTWRLTT